MTDQKGYSSRAANIQPVPKPYIQSSSQDGIFLYASPTRPSVQGTVLTSSSSSASRRTNTILYDAPQLDSQPETTPTHSTPTSVISAAPPMEDSLLLRTPEKSYPSMESPLSISKQKKLECPEVQEALNYLRQEIESQGLSDDFDPLSHPPTLSQNQNTDSMSSPGPTPSLFNSRPFTDASIVSSTVLQTQQTLELFPLPTTSHANSGIPKISFELEHRLSQIIEEEAISLELELERESQSRAQSRHPSMSPGSNADSNSNWGSNSILRAEANSRIPVMSGYLAQTPDSNPNSNPISNDAPGSPSLF